MRSLSTVAALLLLTGCAADAPVEPTAEAATVQPAGQEAETPKVSQPTAVQFARACADHMQAKMEEGGFPVNLALAEHRYEYELLPNDAGRRWVGVTDVELRMESGQKLASRQFTIFAVSSSGLIQIEESLTLCDRKSLYAQ